MCEYCENEELIQDIDGIGVAYIANGCMYVKVHVKPGISTLVFIPIDCCPKCGKDLKVVFEPCPFCGSRRISGMKSNDEDRLFRNYVCCDNCGASTTTYETREQAIYAWNRRDGVGHEA